MNAPDSGTPQPSLFATSDLRTTAESDPESSGAARLSPATADIPRNQHSSADATEGTLSENAALSQLLLEIARLLEEQHAGEFRVRAYRNAAATLQELRTPVREIEAAGGTPALEALPTIGRSIATLIEQYLRTGHLPLLDRLRGEENAERLFAMIPTLGPELSHRIYDALHLETLPELYAAARDGRLNSVPGIGRKRVLAIRDYLAGKIRSEVRPPAASHRNPPQSEQNRQIPVTELLSVDEEYRRRAAEGRLPKIAPRRFNPAAAAWLPILHTERDGRHYTAMFSNTARAHELNTTHDWVVIYRDDHQSDGRWTVITSQFGPLKGCRIVRGREDDCLHHYRRENR
ncbi:DNA polymerase III [Roseiconus nitratireducens]|uniref:DNA polymerase III n=1 Tax=Roseiconus nitratireducens TaxID=2605748 RepID=A0A5M6DHR0_9BACT|nr:DNA polymerase III [Roseiconus nitratireducens]KAA5547087.1 DNA polymerase III [Roseiconus nitratireducens]